VCTTVFYYFPYSFPHSPPRLRGCCFDVAAFSESSLLRVNPMDFNAAAVSLSRTLISTSPPVSLLIQVLMSHTDLQLDHSTRLGNDHTEPERRTQCHRVGIEVVIFAGRNIDIPVRRQNP
jgi:hypothetical protein